MLWGLSRFVLPVENDHNFILVYGKSWILCSKLKIPVLSSEMDPVETMFIR
jgi:hypothetical protein